MFHIKITRIGDERIESNQCIGILVIVVNVHDATLKLMSSLKHPPTDDFRILSHRWTRIFMTGDRNAPDHGVSALDNEKQMIR